MFLKQAYDLGLQIALNEHPDVQHLVKRAATEGRHPHDVAGTVLGGLTGAGLGLGSGVLLGMLGTDDLRKILASGLLGAGAGSVGGSYLGHRMPELAGGVFGGLSGANLGATVGNELGALADASPRVQSAMRTIGGLGGLGGGAYLGHKLLSRD
jgi:hypothetical protein